jgi:hypothetical protein
MITSGRRTLKRTINAFLRRARRRRRARIVLVAAAEISGDKARRIKERLNFFVGSLPGKVSVRFTRRVSWRSAMMADVVLEADQGIVTAGLRRAFDHIFNVDFESNPMDAWDLARANQLLNALPDPGDRAASHSRLIRAVERCRSMGHAKTYIFGTGPSLQEALKHDFSDGVVVVCNTIVRDDALWRHLNPDFVMAGDALYHFGHTAHAKAFRADLRQRLLESRGKTLFVYPETFHGIVRDELGDLDELLIPVPIGDHTDIDVDLCAQFELPALGNVLNALLLPLACTLTPEVCLWGFDGRAPNDKLFWANSSRHSYPELMPALREEHPAFFAHFVPPSKEKSYVESVHGDELDRRLTVAEARGFTFTMMHFSWTDTLNKRRREPV